MHRKDIVIEARESFNDLTWTEHAVLIVGTTGKPNTISMDVLKRLASGSIVVSTSSDRIEIDMDGLNKAASEVVEIEEGNTLYRIPNATGDSEIFVLADGYPINFYASESLPNDTIDPIMTLLLLAALDLSLNPGTINVGINSERVDKITNERQLIERYLTIS
jgi:S-adenosylhomocysteine hydrolase